MIKRSSSFQSGSRSMRMNKLFWFAWINSACKTACLSKRINQSSRWWDPNESLSASRNGGQIMERAILREGVSGVWFSLWWVRRSTVHLFRVYGWTHGWPDLRGSKKVIKTGHTEAVWDHFLIQKKISFEELLTIYLATDGSHGCFWAVLKIEETITDQSSSISMRNKNKKQKQAKAALQASGRFNGPNRNEYRTCTTFYLAEEEHQEYYKKHPEKFLLAIMRDEQLFLEDHWENTHA